MKKKLIWIIPIILLGLLSFWFFTGTSKKSKNIEFRTAVVTKGDIVRLVNATGTLEAVTTVQVGSQVSGTIAALYADFNDRVQKGQLLAQLDTSFLAAQVAEAQANLAKANAALNESKRALARAETLYSANLISSAEYDKALANYETSLAGVEGAKAAVTRAKTNLAYAKIVSPISGTVISRNVDVGQTVAASLNAPTLFIIAQDLSKMRLLASVDEADIGQIAVGNQVTFSVDAFPERVFKGEVEQIRLAPVTVQNVVTYTVVIGVDNSSGKLMPGMTATVTIETARSNDVLKTSSAAIRVRLPGEENKATTSGRRLVDPAKQALIPVGDQKVKASVYVVNSKKQPEKREIEIGLITPSEIEIKSGLTLGDSVIVGIVQDQSTKPNQTNPFNPMSRPGGGGFGGRRGI
ncbi:MAG: efflux RND transporter periplasmic adaptor subunit [bacterium]|nr:efflux RND transporter periplasmic adaptor subunit [bacterium]